jgi:curli biogenesis system outer membrane secretion channel CsgG
MNIKTTINPTTLFAITALLVAPATICRAQTAPPTAQAATEAPKTKRVMVPTFLQLDRKIKDGMPLGQEVADMVTQTLVLQGARVVERTELAVLEKERGMSAGTSDKGGVQELARLKGAAVAVMGKITEFNIVEKQTSETANVAKSVLGRLRANQNTIPNPQAKPYELRVAIDVRLVSVETGDILAASNVLVTEGTDESDINVMLSKSFLGTELVKRGLNAILGSKNAEKLQPEAQSTPQPTDKNSAWNETKVGQCTQRAVKQLVARIMEKLPVATESDFEDMTTLTLQFQGLADYAEAMQLTETIGGLKGVSSAELKSYTAEQTEIALKGSAQAFKTLASSLMKDMLGQTLGLKVVSANREVIVFKK